MSVRKLFVKVVNGFLLFTTFKKNVSSHRSNLLEVLYKKVFLENSQENTSGAGVLL